MTQHTFPRSFAMALARRGGSLLSAAAALLLIPSAPAQSAPLPYATAVANTQVAAHAVLGRKGREACLRGKLTRALLGLSDSCEASGNRGALCVLADRAVVVTPMSLGFMDDTSRQLLKLIQEGGSEDQAAAAVQSPAAVSAPLRP